MVSDLSRNDVSTWSARAPSKPPVSKPATRGNDKAPSPTNDPNGDSSAEDDEASKPPASMPAARVKDKAPSPTNDKARLPSPTKDKAEEAKIMGLNQIFNDGCKRHTTLLNTTGCWLRSCVCGEEAKCSQTAVDCPNNKVILKVLHSLVEGWIKSHQKGTSCQSPNCKLRSPNPNPNARSPSQMIEDSLWVPEQCEKHTPLLLKGGEGKTVQEWTKQICKLAEEGFQPGIALAPASAAEGGSCAEEAGMETGGATTKEAGAQSESPAASTGAAKGKRAPSLLQTSKQWVEASDIFGIVCLIADHCLFLKTLLRTFAPPLPAKKSE